MDFSENIIFFTDQEAECADLPVRVHVDCARACFDSVMIDFNGFADEIAEIPEIAVSDPDLAFEALKEFAKTRYDLLSLAYELKEYC